MRIWLVLWALVMVWGLAPAGETVAQGAGKLLITEVYYDTPGDDSREEWLEIANVGEGAVVLSEYKVGDGAWAGSFEGMGQFPEGSVIEAGQVIVVAQTAQGFGQLFGRLPDYEIQESVADVPNLVAYAVWAEGEIGLANDGDEVLVLDGEDRVVDAVNYGDKDTFFSPAVLGVFRGQSLERVPAGCDTDTAADWQPQLVPTPGVLVTDGVCNDPTADLTILPIGTVQGAGDVSPYVNQEVVVRGLVTGVYEDRNVSGVTFYTLFVQDGGDGLVATSDGLAVFMGRTRPGNELGDEVLLTGTVTEFFGFTELDDSGLQITTLSEGNGLPDPIELELMETDEAAAAYYERLEGMRVTLPLARVVGPTFSGCGFSVVLPDFAPQRLLRHRPTDTIAPIVPVLHNTDVACEGFADVKSGDVVAGLVGPLIYHFEQFKLVQVDPAGLTLTLADLSAIPTPPTLAEGAFVLASFNVENHFDTVDDTGDVAEPKPTAEELAVKQAKLANTISGVLGCPTVLAIQEVETAALLVALAEALLADCGFGYVVSHLESADGRGIDVALLSDPGRVTVGEVVLQQGCTLIDTGIEDEGVDCPAGQQPLFSRPPLHVELAVDGQVWQVLVNHFKSKRGGEGETAPRRLAQAEHINGLVEGLLAENGDALVAVVGDFNDYALSEPLLRMTEAGGLTNVLLAVPEEERYSFVFSGASQLIDGILLSPAAVELVRGVGVAHVNADFPAGWQSDPSTVFRSADHDVPYVVLGAVLPGEVVELTVPAPVLPTETVGVPVATVELSVGGAGEGLVPAGAASGLVWLIGVVVLLAGGAGWFLLRRR